MTDILSSNVSQTQLKCVSLKRTSHALQTHLIYAWNVLQKHQKRGCGLSVRRLPPSSRLDVSWDVSICIFIASWGCPNHVANDHANSRWRQCGQSIDGFTKLFVVIWRTGEFRCSGCGGGGCLAKKMLNGFEWEVEGQMKEKCSSVCTVVYSK